MRRIGVQLGVRLGEIDIEARLARRGRGVGTCGKPEGGYENTADKKHGRPAVHFISPSDPTQFSEKSDRSMKEACPGLASGSKLPLPRYKCPARGEEVFHMSNVRASLRTAPEGAKRAAWANMIFIPTVKDASHGLHGIKSA